MGSPQADWPYVINLGNSIIGVSVLAMPFCFKQCGVILGTLLLLLSAAITNISCGLLVRSAVTTRKRTYEYLALHTFGPFGKLLVEVSIIGMLIGTCVAFYVIIGDLGPVIVSKAIGIENSSSLRTALMVVLAVFVALPLGLLRRVESLSNISAMSIGFYTVFVAEVFTAAFPNLWSGVWVTKVTYWNPEGVFRCLPIFSLAFACQTSLFVMYDALPDPSMKRMSHITKGAIGMCTVVYLMVGYFGYVAFCDDEISGDVLLNFRPTIISEAIKFGFVLSVAVSFPLVIFPCRASIYTLVFSRVPDHAKHDLGGSTVIPEFYSKVITVWIVFSTLLIGILVPNIEFVLAMTGATMGSLICFIFPATMFIHIMSMTKSGSKSTAQLILFLGVTILLASTYVTLNAPKPQPVNTESIVRIADQDDQPALAQDHIQEVEPPKEIKVDGDDVKKDGGGNKEDEEKKEENAAKPEEAEVKEDKRQEPPIPHAPLEDEAHDLEEKDKAKDTKKEAEEGIDKGEEQQNSDTKDKTEQEEKDDKQEDTKQIEEQAHKEKEDAAGEKDAKDEKEKEGKDEKEKAKEHDKTANDEEETESKKKKVPTATLR